MAPQRFAVTRTPDGGKPFTVRGNSTLGDAQKYLSEVRRRYVGRLNMDPTETAYYSDDRRTLYVVSQGKTTAYKIITERP